MSNRFPRVGVIGAGQLARMMVAPATALGVDLLLFASDAQDSGAQITHHVIGDYTNLAQVLDFAKQCDVVTFEQQLGLNACFPALSPRRHCVHDELQTLLLDIGEGRAVQISDHVGRYAKEPGNISDLKLA